MSTGCSMISAWMCFKARSLMVLMIQMLLHVFPMVLLQLPAEDLDDVQEDAEEDVLEEEP